jgi:hypothetical protein
MHYRRSIGCFSIVFYIFLFSSSYAGHWGDFTYTESDGAITITGYSCPDGAAVIPGFIDDKPVVRIGHQAFYNCAGLTSVTIPSSVTAIDQRSFYGCVGLTSVAIPDSVRNIGHNAFYGCTSLSSSPIRSPGSLVIVHRFK